MGKKVIIKEAKEFEKNLGLYGLWSPSENKITIQKGLEEGQKDHTLWHEITHVILDHMGEEELSSNEKFVDLFGGLLAQVIKTLK